MDQRISLITLGVADLEWSKAFYEKLGWVPADGPPGILFYQLPGAIFSLYPIAELEKEFEGKLDLGADNKPHMTLAYNARSREEVDKVLAEAKMAEAIILKDAKEVFWGGYSGYFADPDGHLWEVAHNPFWTIDANGHVSMEAGEA